MLGWDGREQKEGNGVSGFLSFPTLLLDHKISGAECLQIRPPTVAPIPKHKATPLSKGLNHRLAQSTWKCVQMVKGIGGDSKLWASSQDYGQHILEFCIKPLSKK